MDDEIQLYSSLPYYVDQTLSSTPYHNVFKIKTNDGNFQILKVFNKQMLENDFNLENFIVRLRAVRKLDHPNLVPILDITENDNYLFVFTEFCPNGNCLDLIKIKKLGNGEGFRIIQQVFSAIKYLHNQGIPHTHLTLENIVFDGFMVPKLINYGYLTSFSSSPYQASNALEENEKYSYLQSHLGELNYLTPEEIRGVARDIFAIDIWHLGICFFTIYTGQFPFYNRSARKVIHNIINEEIETRKLSYQLRNCIEQCLIKNPVIRAKINMLMNENDKQGFISLTKTTKTVLTIPVTYNPYSVKPRRNSPIDKTNFQSYEASVDPINISLIQRNYSQQFLQLLENEQNKDKERNGKHVELNQMEVLETILPSHQRHKSITPITPKARSAANKRPLASSLFPSNHSKSRALQKQNSN